MDLWLYSLVADERRLANPKEHRINNRNSYPTFCLRLDLPQKKKKKTGTNRNHVITGLQDLQSGLVH